jgi:uncharacterized membrane protein
MKIGTTRVETFSDGVIAIIITIMVLELKLPDLSKENTTTTILTHIRHLLPYFSIYAFSFMMIALFWTNHHHMFHLLEHTDEHLLWQNFIFLFLLSLIPFTTSLVGSNPLVPLSVAIYGLIMLLTTLSFTLMRHYSIRNKLLHKDKDVILNNRIAKVSFKARTKAIVATIMYLIAIPLAYVNVYFAYGCFLIPPLIFFIPEGIDDEKLAEIVEEKNA